MKPVMERSLGVRKDNEVPMDHLGTRRSNIYKDYFKRIKGVTSGKSSM